MFMCVWMHLGLFTLHCECTLQLTSMCIWHNFFTPLIINTVHNIILLLWEQLFCMNHNLNLFIPNNETPSNVVGRYIHKWNRHKAYPHFLDKWNKLVKCPERVHFCKFKGRPISSLSPSFSYVDRWTAEFSISEFCLLYFHPNVKASCYNVFQLMARNQRSFSY